MATLEKVNIPPTPAEAQYLRTLVEEDETELAHIRQAKLELLAREDIVCARMKKNRAILSSIRRLPPEILAIIFILWHETSEDQSRTQPHTCHLAGAQLLSYPSLVDPREALFFQPKTR